MFLILNALFWRFLAAGVLAAVLFTGGCQFGEGRVTAQWDAQKAVANQAVVKQTERVAMASAQQSIINQEISNDFQKTKKAIATDSRSLLARVPRRVRVDAASRDGTVSSFSEPAIRIDAGTADAVSDPTGSPLSVSCKQLASDATEATLMVLSFQRWYFEQSKASASDRSDQAVP